MEYQKIINLLDNKPHQSSNFRTKNWAEINDELHGVYGTGSQIRFKTSKLRSSFFVYIDAYMLVNGRKLLEQEHMMIKMNRRKKERKK